MASRCFCYQCVHTLRHSGLIHNHNNIIYASRYVVYLSNAWKRPIKLFDIVAFLWNYHRLAQVFRFQLINLGAIMGVWRQLNKKNVCKRQSLNSILTSIFLERDGKTFPLIIQVIISWRKCFMHVEKLENWKRYVLRNWHYGYGRGSLIPLRSWEIKNIRFGMVEMWKNWD